jgi:hypothetical protein
MVEDEYGTSTEALEDASAHGEEDTVGPFPHVAVKCHDWYSADKLFSSHVTRIDRITRSRDHENSIKM